MHTNTTELGVKISDKYIYIQEVTEGYDYTITNNEYRELDGGVYDNPDISIQNALNNIIEDLKDEGVINENDDIMFINAEDLIEKIENTNTI